MKTNLTWIRGMSDMSIEYMMLKCEIWIAFEFTQRCISSRKRYTIRGDTFSSISIIRA